MDYETLMEPLDLAKLSDRELLLILHVKQTAMGIDVKEIKDDTKEKLATLTARVDMLDQHKVDKTEMTKIVSNQDAQGRQINRLTNYLWAAAGGLAIFQVAIQVYLSLHK